MRYFKDSNNSFIFSDQPNMRTPKGMTEASEADYNAVMSAALTDAHRSKLEMVGADLADVPDTTHAVAADLTKSAPLVRRKDRTNEAPIV